MTEQKSIKVGEIVRCICPDCDCVLPDGLPTGAVAQVMATYVDKAIVSYNGKTFDLPASCAYPMRLSH